MFEIDLFGVFGIDILEEDINAKLKSANGQDINVNIASIGGYTDSGVAIYNLFRNYKRNNPNSKLTAKLVGYIASMASYFAMSPVFSKVVVEDNTPLMLHNSWTVAIGNKNDLRDTANYLDGVDKPMVDLVAGKMDISKEEAQAILDKETWYFGQAIVDAGLADEVIKGDGLETDKSTGMMKIKNAKAKMEKLSFGSYVDRVAAAFYTSGLDNTPQATVGSYDANIKIIDQTWDQSAAEKRWRTHASAEDGPNAKYRQAFMWFDGDNSENFTAYKLQVKDFIDGSEVVNIRAVNNVSARLGQTQGPTADEKDRIQSIIDRYQERWRSQQENNAMNEEEVRQEGVNAENERISGIMALKEKYGENLKDSPGVFAKISEIVDKGVVDKKANMQSVLTDINLFLTSGNIQAALESPGSTPQGGASSASGEPASGDDAPHGEDW